MKEKPKERHLLAVVMLVVLAPVTFILLTLLYGMDALVIRETVQRWGGGWLSILLLGFAYGIFEEGIVVHSFFDPTWMDLGLLATYGRWAGINWVWTIALTIFHGAVSISIPIALTEMVFPQMRGVQWLSRRGYTTAVILFFLNTILAPLFVNQYSIPGYFASAAAMLALFLAARKVTNQDGAAKKVADVKQGKVIIFGFLMMAAMIAGMWILPGLAVPWPLTFLLMCALPWAAVAWLRKHGVDGWNGVLKWALIFGLTFPWLLLAVISELDNANRPDDTSGMIITALVFIVFLLLIRISVNKREHPIPEG